MSTTFCAISSIRKATLGVLLVAQAVAMFGAFGAAPATAQRTVGRPTGKTAQEVSEWSFPTSEVRSLAIENYSGDIVLRKSSRRDLYIKAAKHNASKEELGKVVIDLKRQGEGVVCKVNYLEEFSSAAVSFEIETPPGVTVSLTSSSGSIDVEKFDGKLDAETGSGAIILRDADGEIQATTGSGNINAYYSQPLRQVGPQPTLEEGRRKWSSRIIKNAEGGNIVMRANLRSGGGAPITLTSSSGKVTLHLNPSLSVNILAETISNKFSSDFHEIRRTDESRFAGGLNGGGALVFLSTSTGAIEVRRQ